MSSSPPCPRRPACPRHRPAKLWTLLSDAIQETLAKGDEVKIVGFGTFTVAHRAAGEARNPRTGEKVQVPASKTPKFKAGAGLKDAVNK